MFLKIRKNILRTIGPKLMQEIILTHGTENSYFRGCDYFISYFVCDWDEELYVKENSWVILFFEEKITK